MLFTSGELEEFQVEDGQVFFICMLLVGSQVGRAFA